MKLDHDQSSNPAGTCPNNCRFFVLGAALEAERPHTPAGAHLAEHRSLLSEAGSTSKRKIGMCLLRCS